MSPTRQTAICGSQCLTMGGDGDLIPSFPVGQSWQSGSLTCLGLSGIPDGTRRDAELRLMVSVSSYLGEVVPYISLHTQTTHNSHYIQDHILHLASTSRARIYITSHRIASETPRTDDGLNRPEKLRLSGVPSPPSCLESPCPNWHRNLIAALTTSEHVRGFFSGRTQYR